MSRNLLMPISALLALLWGLSLWSPRFRASAPLLTAHAQPRQALTERIQPQTGICTRWNFQLHEGAQLSPQLVEMSGIAFSSYWRDVVYHIADSGNPPLILMTDPEGHLLRGVPYGERSSDPEDLDVGPCPWGSSCLFIADTGDNFGLRSKRQIHIIDEASLEQPRLRSEVISFRFADDVSYDVEALAVHPKSGAIYLFTKEKKRSQVFRLEGPWTDAEAVAQPIAELPLRRVTGAQFHPSGDRLLLINAKGATELSLSASSGFTTETRSWYPYQRSIELLPLVQQEAIAYAPSGLSLIYSSERKKWSNKPWGLVEAKCQDPLEAAAALR